MTTSGTWSPTEALGYLAILSAVILVAPALAPVPLVLDEHVAYWLCEPQDSLSIAERNLRYAATPPLCSWCQAGALRLLGKSERTMRLPSLAGYVAAVALMYFGGRSILGGLGAGVASLALAWHPDVVDEIRIGRPYGLVVFELTLLMLVSLRLSTNRPSEWHRSYWLGGVWGMTAAVAVWTHVLTIPTIGCLALALLSYDWYRLRRMQTALVIGPIIAFALCVPLLPMLYRMWDWRFSLNFKTGSGSALDAVGIFIPIGLPLSLLIGLVGARRRRALPREAPDRLESGLWITAMAGIVPVLVLLFAVGGFPSLSSARYRLPLAPAQSLLLSLLLRRAGTLWAINGLAAVLLCCWAAAGVSPFTLRQLGTPQAQVWQQMAEDFETFVRSSDLQDAPLFVQGGLIEGTLIPALYDDPDFHRYVSSRLGRFYAETPNPRYGLPFFWDPAYPRMFEGFRRLAREAPGNRGDVFLAVAIDTDVNRGSMAVFVELLQGMGYQFVSLAEYEPWAVLYHGTRSSK